MAGSKLPREVRKKINTLAFSNTQDCIPRNKAYLKQKAILLSVFGQFLSAGIAVNKALELLKDPQFKYSDKYSEAMKKLRNWV